MTSQQRLLNADRQQFAPELTEEEREAYRERLREKLQDPAFRAIEGFPVGSDEAILSLSDPPYYTACPNPFLEEFIEQYGRPYDPNERYHREPFAVDVSEGKNHPIYNAHTYHTKVPHRAIMRYVLHYTNPGDIVLDVFAGTGMSGVAANLCGDDSEAAPVAAELNKMGSNSAALGKRLALLVDLSPAATFIANGLVTSTEVEAFLNRIRQIVAATEVEIGWMYRTLHMPTETQLLEAIRDFEPRTAPASLPFGRINYTVWSDVFVCPTCETDFVYWDAALDDTGQIQSHFLCPNCRAELTKSHSLRAWESRFDPATSQVVRQFLQVPVLINYRYNNKRFAKTPDVYDLHMLEKISSSPCPNWFPTDRMPEGDEARRNDDLGVTNVHHFYTDRNLRALAALRAKCEGKELLAFQAEAVTLCSRLVRFNMGKRGNGPLSGTLYMPSLSAEADVLKAFAGKADDLARAFGSARTALVSTQSATDLHIPTNSVDYIFTDPPFGGNLMYSDLNFIWETWLRVKTSNTNEAIESRAQSKGMPEYSALMTRCLSECFRVLKPGRWITIEFHNSKNRVWIAIQEAMQRSGFVIADVRTLDKKQNTFKQTTGSGAVDQDLVISAYKPAGQLELRFSLENGNLESAWDFVREHLWHLPVVVMNQATMESIPERRDYLLFDRMVAFHVQRGVSVPLSAAEFYAGLRQRFPERDGMFFLPEQVPQYEAARLTADSIGQLDLFVADEKSSLQWLRQQLDPALGGTPQTYQEVQPKFLKQLPPGQA